MKSSKETRTEDDATVLFWLRLIRVYFKSRRESEIAKSYLVLKVDLQRSLSVRARILDCRISDEILAIDDAKWISWKLRFSLSFFPSFRYSKLPSRTDPALTSWSCAITGTVIKCKSTQCTRRARALHHRAPFPPTTHPSFPPAFLLNGDERALPSAQGRRRSTWRPKSYRTTRSR